MTARKWALVIVGLLVLFLGIVFALQGANVIGGSTVMSGNPTYIYVGGAVALLGIVLLTMGLLSRSKKVLSSSPAAGDTPKNFTAT